MKMKFILLVLASLSLQVRADEPAKVAPKDPTKTNEVDNITPRWPELKTEKDKLSYSMGFDMAAFQLSHRELLDRERMVQGFRDAFDMHKPMLDLPEAKELMEKYEKDVQELEKKEAELLAVKNRRDGQKYLEENKKKEGVKVTASGLQYKVIKEGKSDGAKPNLESRVRFHYKVKDVAGMLLDDSHELAKGVPASIRSMMQGWKEGLQLMKEGAVYEFAVPSDLAYGEHGAGRSIKANQTLVTEVELISVEK